MNKRGKALIVFLIIGIIIALAVAIYFMFFFHYSCADNDLACFKSYQAKCLKTKFINDQPDATWNYVIQGKSKGICEIEVTILKVKTGDVGNKALEGQSMICSLPIGSIDSPESDTSKCHGRLKEEMQNLIIQKLHSYVVGNLGEIETSLNSINSIQGNITAGNSS
ncbi:MAG: hypothetical protein AABX48_00570 [Nanoarchaeota archaeon]